MTEVHVVLGNGIVGSRLASRLANLGNRVLLISCTGSGPVIPNVQRLKADASSFESLSSVAPAATFVYNCVNPPYDKWDKEWPSINKAVIEYAIRTQAVLVTCSNLYGYGPRAFIVTGKQIGRAHV